MRTNPLFNTWTPDSALCVGALARPVIIPTALGVAAVFGYKFAEPEIRKGINKNVKNPTVSGLLHMGLDIIDGTTGGGGNGGK